MVNTIKESPFENFLIDRSLIKDFVENMLQYVNTKFRN